MMDDADKKLGSWAEIIEMRNVETPQTSGEIESLCSCDLSTSFMSTDEMAAIFARKAALRKGMLKTLRGLSETELASQCEQASRLGLTAAEAVARVLAAQPFYQQAKSVACYLSMAKGELRTDALVRDLLKRMPSWSS